MAGFVAPPNNGGAPPRKSRHSFSSLTIRASLILSYRRFTPTAPRLRPSRTLDEVRRRRFTTPTRGGSAFFLAVAGLRAATFTRIASAPPCAPAIRAPVAGWKSVRMSALVVGRSLRVTGSKGSRFARPASRASALTSADAPAGSSSMGRRGRPRWDTRRIGALFQTPPRRSRTWSGVRRGGGL
jgi:hypothetical protein